MLRVAVVLVCFLVGGAASADTAAPASAGGVETLALHALVGPVRSPPNRGPEVWHISFETTRGWYVDDEPLDIHRCPQTIEDKSERWRVIQFFECRVYPIDGGVFLFDLVGFLYCDFSTERPRCSALTPLRGWSARGKDSGHAPTQRTGDQLTIAGHRFRLGR